jgi:poly-gamma-glutamate synthesis protein (capsule biosynthesis protein)
MKVALLGDIGLFGKFCLDENKQLKEYLKDVRELLLTHDVVIGNLETPFVEKVTPFGAKSAHIYAKPMSVDTLNYLNISVVNLANNHIYDFGNESYELTKKILSENNIEFFGIESKQSYIDRDGIKLALHGYCSYNTNPQMITFDESKGINGLDVDIVKEKLKTNTDQGYINIISVHSGIEHVNYPSLDDIKLARMLADTTPYIYYGHHPHVIQGIEHYKNSVLCYSLGNFCFSDVYTDKAKEPLIKQSKNNKTGLILSLELNETGIVGYEAIPIFMGDKKMEVGSDEINNKLEEYSSALNASPENYQKARQILINNYVATRKNMRNFSWYIKRLKLTSLVQIFNSKMNARRYKKCVKLKIDE